MKPWYDPINMSISLGITLPFFIYYIWRFYSSVADHGEEFRRLCIFNWIESALPPGWGASQTGAQLFLGAVSAQFDESLMTVRRKMIYDSNILILLGFFGTLLGFLESFQNFQITTGNPLSAIDHITGGLGTAVISSLLSAMLAIFIRVYLAGTEKKVAGLKVKIIEHCCYLYRLHGRDTCLPT